MPINNNFEVGQLVRELRRQRGMTGEILGQKVGLSQSKISKIESGVDKNLPAAKLETVLNILNAPETIRQRIRMAANGPQTTLRVNHYKTKQPFVEVLERERRAHSIEVFTSSLIPALLQTIEYREALLKQRELTTDVFRLAMQTAIKRQDLLWDRRRHYHFIIQEAALYTLMGNPVIQVGQLDRLDRFVGLPNVRLGVIPLKAGLAPIDNGPFVLFDDKLLLKMIGDGDIFSDTAEVVATHLNIFKNLDQRADYGEAARALIHQAMDYFN